MSILSSIGNFGLHPCDEISYKQGVNVWPGPHKLHEKTMCKTSSSLFALQGEQILLRRLLPLPLPPLLLTSPCKRWWVKASTQSRLRGLGSPGRSILVRFFSVLPWLYLHSFFSPCPFTAFLLCSVTVYEPSLERAAERTYSNSCHGQLGAEVSSNISFGFGQELRWWDFSPCCTLSLRESCALQWSVPLPRKPYIGSPVLNSCTPPPQNPCFLCCSINHLC